MCICSPGVVELVRSNLAPDFPLFHDPAPDLMNVTSLLSRTVLDFNFETLPHTVLVHCIIPASQPVLLQNFMPLFFANIVLDLETFPYYYLSCKSWVCLCWWCGVVQLSLRWLSAIVSLWRHNTIMVKNNKFFSVKIALILWTLLPSVSNYITSETEINRYFSILHLSKYQV